MWNQEIRNFSCLWNTRRMIHEFFLVFRFPKNKWYKNVQHSMTCNYRVDISFGFCKGTFDYTKAPLFMFLQIKQWIILLLFHSIWQYMWQLLIPYKCRATNSARFCSFLKISKFLCWLPNRVSKLSYFRGLGKKLVFNPLFSVEGDARVCSVCGVRRVRPAPPRTPAAVGRTMRPTIS